MNQLSNTPNFIYWFAYYNIDSPSVRYRALYPLEDLAMNFGIESELVMPSYHPKRVIRFVKWYFKALFDKNDDSIIVIQSVYSNFIYCNLLFFLIKIRKDKVYYDLDDAHYLERSAQRIFKFVKRTKGVFLGSVELVNEMKGLNDNLYLTTSPVKRLGITKSKKSEVLNIGWIGCFGGGHKASLLSDAFPAIIDLNYNVTLTIIGIYKKKEEVFLRNYFSKYSHVNLIIEEGIDWHNEQHIQNLVVKLDVGLATLDDTLLHKCKSAFKLKQYMNNGIPVLSSNKPENSRFVKPNVNGYFCDSPSEFKFRFDQFNKMNNSEYEVLSKGALNSVVNFDINHYNGVFVNSI